MEQSEKAFDFNIVLIGFMGSGKSTIAKRLAASHDMEIVEMDQIIAEREQMTISEIFKVHGEEYFRNLETNLLKELQSKKNVIISCGGGVPMRDENVVEMKKNGKVIFLVAEPETILQRVKNDHSRPLLEGNKNVEFIAELMGKRRAKYEAASDFIVHVDGKDPSQISEEIISLIR